MSERSNSYLTREQEMAAIKEPRESCAVYGVTDADWQNLALFLLHKAGGSVTVNKEDAIAYFAATRKRRVVLSTTHDIQHDTLRITWRDKP